MCFNLSAKDRMRKRKPNGLPHAHIAKKAITCYKAAVKAGSGVYMTPHRDFEIKKGTPYIFSAYGGEIVALAMKMVPTRTTSKNAGRKRVSTRTSKKRVAKRKGKG